MALEMGIFLTTLKFITLLWVKVNVNKGLNIYCMKATQSWCMPAWYALLWWTAPFGLSRLTQRV